MNKFFSITAIFFLSATSAIAVDVTRPNNCAKPLNAQTVITDLVAFNDVAYADIVFAKNPRNGADFADAAQCLFFDIHYNDERRKQLLSSDAANASAEYIERTNIGQDLLKAIQGIN